MFTGIYQSIAILITVIIFYSLDLVLAKRYDRQRQAKGTGFAWDYWLIMLLVGVLLIIQPVYLPWLGLVTKSSWGLAVQIAGIFILASAIVLHVWSRFHLRQFYAERVEVQPGHQVINTGPYSIVRHPIILSFFGLAIGVFMITPAVTTLLLMLYTFWDFTNSARKEENLLAENIPDYKEYMKSTPRFLPRIRRNP